MKKLFYLFLIIFGSMNAVDSTSTSQFLEILKKQKVLNKKLILATKQENVDLVNMLLQNGADAQYKENDALKWASILGNTSIIEILIKARANIHAKENMALRLTVLKNHLPAARLLLSYGANVHALQNQSLKWAAAEGYLDMVNLLIEAGADIYSINLLGDTALSLAEKFNHTNVANRLKEVMKEKST